MGTKPDREVTLDDVARELGISRECARQIEVRALRKLRRALERRGVSADDLLPTPCTAPGTPGWCADDGTPE
ncbi:sigma factor-like helix-turn-helix DNA-binding protein [Ectothiorhodospira shaposhnikovii]|uniref:sigma factor-like helix-turn-helix DNA-binding protein n=1 Tax=Ectothiorhodospira shaposhnikovii TaxID=1054 RepID=UPI0039A28847